MVKTFETGRKPALGGSTGAPAELLAMAMATVDCAFRAPAGTTTRAPSSPVTVPPVAPTRAMPGRACAGASVPPPPQAARSTSRPIAQAARIDLVAMFLSPSTASGAAWQGL